jgi:orotidine-5'-phosphate decarboxylase
VTATALQKLDARMDEVDSLLCVGLDSAVERLPARFRSESRPQLAFNRWVIEQTFQSVAAYKPNMAFYEARGAAGWQELALTMEYLRAEHPSIFTICDAKRADIDSTNSGYVTGLLDELGFDAITLHPYLGADGLRPFLDRADKACIILCRTSNEGAAELQDLRVGDERLWEVVARRVGSDWNRHGNCMLVVGATYPAELERAREICPDVPFLVPGVGAQGGEVEEVIRRGLDARGRGLLINVSRSVIFADDPAEEAARVRDAIRRARTDVMAALS